jgi:hypothetical protein
MRRKNSAVTFLLFVGVLAFGYAAYHFIYEEKVFARSDAPPPPREQVEEMKTQIDQSLSSEGCYVGIQAINWRPNAANYRVDVQMADGCSKGDARRIAERVAELVKRASKGVESEVWVYVLGRDVYHQLP